MSTDIHILMHEIGRGSLEKLKELLNTFKISYSKDGYVLLLHAIGSKHIEIAKFLLMNGSNVNIENNQFTNTPLHFACINGDVEIIEMLLNRTADINANGKFGQTPLHNAVDCNQRRIIELLLNRGAHINAGDKGGKTPLHIASSKENYPNLYTPCGGCDYRADVVELLLRNGAEINANTKDNLTALHIAIECENKKMVKQLLGYGANVDAEDKNGETILHLAVKKGHKSIVKCVLQSCPDVNSTGNRRSLITAISGFNEYYRKIIEILHNYGFTIDYKELNDIKLLHTGARSRDFKFVKEVLKYGADVNITDKNGNTPLYYASLRSDLNIAKLLLSNGANIDECSPKCHVLFQNGANLLFRAAETGNHLLTKMLLDKGVNVNIKQNDQTALHVGSEKGYVKVVEVLLQYGAEPDSRDNEGCTPLHRVIVNKCDGRNYGKKQVINVLSMFGADINCRDRDGRTPLHYASATGYSTLVTILLESGSDINIIDKMLHTPVDIAMNNNLHGEYFDSYNYSTANRNEQVRIDFNQHILKRDAANLYMRDKNMHWACRDDLLQFYYDCKKEVEKLRKERICTDNTVTFYDVLSKGIKQLPIYAANNNITQVLESGDYKEKFPLYASMISNQFKRGRQRERLINRSTNALISLFQCESPEIFAEELFTYLSDRDLINLIKAGPDTDITEIMSCYIEDMQRMNADKLRLDIMFL